MSKKKILILSQFGQGHYSYYNDIIRAYIKNAVFIDMLNMNMKTYFKLFSILRQSERVIVLNGRRLFIKNPLILISIIITNIKAKVYLYDMESFVSNAWNQRLYRLIVNISIYLNKNLDIMFLLNFKTNSKKINDRIKITSDPIDSNKLKIDKVNIASNLLQISEPFILLFGTHTKRKGTYEFVNNPCFTKIKKVIVGRILDERLMGYCDKTNLSKEIEIIPKYVSDEELSYLIDKSIALAIPYINWTGSSGVLGLAIVHSKVILVNDTGTIGKIAKEYNKSIFIDSKLWTIGDIIKMDTVEDNSNAVLNKYYNVNKFINDIIS